MLQPNRAVVLCVDEKSQIQALDREQPVLPMAPGVAERRTHTYVRNGAMSLFASLDVAIGAGGRLATARMVYRAALKLPTHSSRTWLDFP